MPDRPIGQAGNFEIVPAGLTSIQAARTEKWNSWPPMRVLQPPTPPDSSLQAGRPPLQAETPAVDSPFQRSKERLAAKGIETIDNARLIFQKESRHCQMYMFPRPSMPSQMRRARQGSPDIGGSSLSFSSHGMHTPGLRRELLEQGSDLVPDSGPAADCEEAE